MKTKNKTSSDAQNDGRAYKCELCYGDVLICTRCDRHNIYCKVCAPIAAKNSLDRAKAKWAASEAGKRSKAAANLKYYLTVTKPKRQKSKTDKGSIKDKNSVGISSESKPQAQVDVCAQEKSNDVPQENTQSDQDCGHIGQNLTTHIDQLSDVCGQTDTTVAYALSHRADLERFWHAIDKTDKGSTPPLLGVLLGAERKDAGPCSDPIIYRCSMCGANISVLVRLEPQQRRGSKPKSPQQQGPP